MSNKNVRKINRALRHPNHFLPRYTLIRKCRESSKDFWRLGSYFLVDSGNCVIGRDVDINEVAKQLKITVD
jgi:hypothetical protein